MHYNAALIRVYTFFNGNKGIQTKGYAIIFEKYNLTPLDMYNGPSQPYVSNQNE